MAEGNLVSSGTAYDVPKIVSMKLFASWEIDKTSSSCIPRLCMFSLTNLQINPGLLDDDVRNVIIAVQMAGSKRVLRSGEITLNSVCNDTPLDISFSLQYAHFLKRDDNNLRIALQRRKKYKNRAFLGYKNLAVGVINLSEVLQRPKDMDLDLCVSLAKDKTKMAARVTLQSIISKPVTYDDGKHMSLSGAERSAESEDDDDDMIDEELSLDDSMSDEETPHRQVREQTNLKQKFARLLRRFKSSDDAEKHILTVLERDQTIPGGDDEASNLDELLDQLENISEDSESDRDNISIVSTAKPTLPTYFDNSKTSSLESNKKRISVAESERDSLEGSTGFVNYTGIHDVSSPLASESGYTVGGVSVSSTTTHHPMLSSTLSTATQDDVFASDNTLLLEYNDTALSEKAQQRTYYTAVYKDSAQCLPPVIYVVDERTSNTYYPAAHLIYQSLNSSINKPVLRIADKEDFREMIKQTAIAIQSFSNNNSRAPSIKLVLIGDDGYFNQVLNAFVQIFAEKSPDWLHYVKFLPVPLGSSKLSKQIAHVDSAYHQIFTNDRVWQRLNEKYTLCSYMSGDCSELLERIYKYEGGATAVMQYPVCEAMIALASSKDNKNDSQEQEFLPFLTEVLIGHMTSSSSNVGSGSAPVSIPGSSDGEDQSTAAVSTSPAAAASSSYTDTKHSSVSTGGERLTSTASNNLTPSPPGSAGGDIPELQLEYWVANRAPSAGDKAKNALTKETLKGYFKFVQITRGKSSFKLVAATREKKGKIMRIGKKSKDKYKEKELSDTKSLNITREGITRIICTAKDSNDYFTVHIDQLEHSAIHFFQLSTQWKSHVKYLPIGVSKQYMPSSDGQ